jgi:putative tricarboxylic transport membrane protein
LFSLFFFCFYVIFLCLLILQRIALNVVNRAGGSGAVGYTYLINKKGDPHVIAGAAPTIVSAKIEGRLPADHRDGMTVLMIVAIDELMLSVRTESPFKAIEDFVKAAKDRAGQLTVCGTGTNSEDHIFAYLFEKAATIKFKYVPFQSGGECVTALMGGHVDAGIMNPNEIIAQIEAKRARNLAVAAKKPCPTRRTCRRSPRRGTSSTGSRCAAWWAAPACRPRS